MKNGIMLRATIITIASLSAAAFDFSLSRIHTHTSTNRAAQPTVQETHLAANCQMWGCKHTTDHTHCQHELLFRNDSPSIIQAVPQIM